MSNTSTSKKNTTEAVEGEIVVFGISKTEYDALPYKEQMRVQANDPESPLANQLTPELVVTLQLLNSAPVQIIEAMTGLSRKAISDEAEKLGVNLKVPQAGNLR